MTLKAMRPKVKPGTARCPAKLVEVCLVGVAVVGEAVVALTTVTLVRVVGVAVVLGTSEVELAVVNGVVCAGVDGAAEGSGVEAAGGGLEKVAMVGVSDTLAEAVVEGEIGTGVVLEAAGELGAAEELGTSGTDGVEVLHSVVVVLITAVVVYYITESRISIA
jgi:hypothetical protein